MRSEDVTTHYLSDVYLKVQRDLRVVKMPWGVSWFPVLGGLSWVLLYSLYRLLG